MDLDGYYRTLLRASTESYHWLRFYADGTVLAARTGGRAETLAAWFGCGEGEFADGSGSYTLRGADIHFSLTSAETTSQHEGTFLRDQLLLRDQHYYTFVPFPTSRTTLFRATGPIPKDEPAPQVPALAAVPLAWWRYAQAQGFRCRRCGKVPELEERECWLDTACCTECAIEDGR